MYVCLLLAYLGQLVHSFPTVVGMHVPVLSPEMTPLVPVHRSEVANFAVGQSAAVQELARSIAVPDVNFLSLHTINRPSRATDTESDQNCTHRRHTCSRACAVSHLQPQAQARTNALLVRWRWLTQK